MRRYYEFALVVVLLGILAIVLTRTLDEVGSRSEEAGVQLEVAAIRGQLLEVVAHRETFGGKLPASDNPIDWLDARLLRDYRGALDDAPEAHSVWYFDRREKVLVYRFRDGHAARYRLNREAGRSDSPGVLAGVGLQRLDDRRQ